MLRLHRSWAVARKEMRDIVRDRRTVFMAVIFPLVLYPLLIIGVVQATAVEEGRSAKRTLAVAINGMDNAPGIVGEIAKKEGLEVVEYVEDAGRFGHKDAVLAMIFPKEFKNLLSENHTARVAVFYDGADPASEEALTKVVEVLNGVTIYLRDLRLKSRDLTREFVEPLAVDKIDMATAKQRGAFRFGQVLAFLLVVLCLMGALYPALDAVAGEKERGTLETLLSIPATRLEILGGKYAAVLAMSVASVVSNFVSLSATLAMVNYLMRMQPQKGAPVDFTISMSASLLFIPALLPLAAFFSAVTLGVASFARSTREGQYYLGPLYAIVLPLTAVALSPTVRLTWVTAFVPVLSTALFLKEGLLGTLATGPAVATCALTFVYGAIALKWAAGVFSREDVLFSSPVSAETPADGRIAAASHVVFVWAVSLILFFFFGTGFLKKHGIAEPWAVLAVYAGCTLAPIALYALVWRLNLKKTFALGRLEGGKIVATALFIPAAVLLGMAAKGVQSYFLRAPKSVAAAASVEEASIYALFLSIALLPAVAEEIFYRGFVYRSLAARLRPSAAIILSAALFAAAHLNPYEALPLFALGVVLALAAKRTGGLAAPMIIHFSNNALTLAVMTRLLRGRLFTAELSGPWAAVTAAGMAVVGVGLLWAASRAAGAESG